MNAPGQRRDWSRLGWRLIVSSLALAIPAVFAILYIAYSFSLGYTVQNILMYSIIGLEVALFVAGVIMVIVGRLQRSSRGP
jgi:hypothetical protein